MDRIEETEHWWRTSITDIAADAIRIRGYAIEDLMGRVGLTDMIWLLIKGELPSEAQSALLRSAMLGGVVHGPHAPSIAIARMAITCGVGVNQAVAQGAAVLGDVHGGAVEQLMELLESIEDEDDKDAAAGRALDVWTSRNGRFVPGFGHRFHRHGDPRSARLIALADDARLQGIIAGNYVARLQAIERAIASRKGKSVPINLDGIAGAVFLELGFAPPLGRGFIVIARSIGILANTWEEMGQGSRLKGPVPKSMGYLYEGPGARSIPESWRR